MLYIAKLLSFVRTIRNGANISDVKVDLGGGDIKTAEHFAPPGDDSFPLTTDRPIVTDTQRSGGKAVIGYVDPVNTPKALEGDKRIYARDANTGLVVVEVWLKSDGSAITSNANGSFTLNSDGSQKGINSNGSFELRADGIFEVNGVTIDTNGKIFSPTDIEVVDSLTVNGIEMKTHHHEQGNDNNGDVEQDTGGPIS